MYAMHWQPLPSCHGAEVGYALGKLPVHHRKTKTHPHLQPNSKPESELGMVFFELWYKTRICVGIYTLLEYLFFYFILLHSAFLHSYLYFLLLTLSGICCSPSLHTFKNQNIKTIVLACPSLMLIVHNEKKAK